MSLTDTTRCDRSVTALKIMLNYKIKIYANCSNVQNN